MGLARHNDGRMVGLDTPLTGRVIAKKVAVLTPTVGEDVVELAVEPGMIGMDIGSLGFERLFGDDGRESRKWDKDGETARRFDAF